MAHKVEVHLEDDLGGGPAEHTVTFALNGKDHEIDLLNSNAAKLSDSLRPYAAAGRKASRASGTRSAWTRSSSTDPDTAKIRAWAKDNGDPVSDRGRIHQSVEDACYAAH